MITMMFQFFDLSKQEIPQEKKQYLLLKSAKDLFKNINLQHLENKDVTTDKTTESIILTEETLQEDIPNYSAMSIFEPFSIFDTTTKDPAELAEMKPKTATVTQTQKKKTEKGQELHKNMLQALLGAK